MITVTITEAGEVQSVKFGDRLAAGKEQDSRSPALQILKVVCLELVAPKATGAGPCVRVNGTLYCP